MASRTITATATSMAIGGQKWLAPLALYFGFGGQVTMYCGPREPWEALRVGMLIDRVTRKDITN